MTRRLIQAMAPVPSPLPEPEDSGEDRPSGTHPRVPPASSEGRIVDGQALRVIVHDLKGPLSAMMLNVEFALENVEPSPDGSERPVRAALVDCRLAGARLYRMVSNLLDLAREAHDPFGIVLRTVDLGKLLEHAVLEHHDELAMRRLLVSTEAPHGGRIRSDPELLARIVTALFEVLLRRTRPRGTLTLEGTVDALGFGLRIASSDRLAIQLPALDALAAPRSRGDSPDDDLHILLDLVFARRAVAALGGTLELTSRAGATAFVLRF